MPTNVWVTWIAAKISELLPSILGFGPRGLVPGGIDGGGRGLVGFSTPYRLTPRFQQLELPVMAALNAHGPVACGRGKLESFELLPRRGHLIHVELL